VGNIFSFIQKTQLPMKERTLSHADGDFNMSMPHPLWVCLILLWNGGMACKNKNSATNPAYTLTPKNATVPNNYQLCLAKGPGYVFQDEVCYNPAVVAQQQAACAKTPGMIWASETLACVGNQAFQQYQCASQTRDGVFLNGACYGPTQEQPKDCTPQHWDGIQCVPPTTARNYYRSCISPLLGPNGQQLVQALEALVETTTCQASYLALSAVTSLSLPSKGLVDISPLVGLNAVTNLDLSNNEIADLTALTYLPKLTQLNLSNNKITSFQYLQNLQNLTSLQVAGNSATNYQFLGNLPNLQTLDIAATVASSMCSKSGVTTPAILAACPH
jgi:hypothetical protein